MSSQGVPGLRRTPPTILIVDVASSLNEWRVSEDTLPALWTDCTTLEVGKYIWGNSETAAVAPGERDHVC